MNKRSDDYIPTYADIEAEKNRREEYLKEHKATVHSYTATYKINGKAYTSKLAGQTTADAEDNLRHDCDMIGWIPTDIVIKMDPED